MATKSSKRGVPEGPSQMPFSSLFSLRCDAMRVGVWNRQLTCHTHMCVWMYVCVCGSGGKESCQEKCRGKLQAMAKFLCTSFSPTLFSLFAHFSLPCGRFMSFAFAPPTHIPTSFSTIFRTLFPSFRALALGEFTCACIRLVLHSAPPRGKKGKQIWAKFPLSSWPSFVFWLCG